MRLVSLRPCGLVGITETRSKRLVSRYILTPLRRPTNNFADAANTPASRDLGHEIDLLWTFTLNPRIEVLVGYSHFFAGKYYKYTPGITSRDDGDFLYTQYQWNF